MLQRGDSVPQFDVRTVEDRPISYSAIWQRQNLVLITLPDVQCTACAVYIAQLTAHISAFANQNSECVITRDRVPETAVVCPSSLRATDPPHNRPDCHVNGPRRGVDSRCSLSVDLIDGGQIFVKAISAWPFAAVSQAASRLSKVLRRTGERGTAHRESSGHLGHLDIA
jgi:ribosome-associated translation inhibitor RaiA